MYVKHITIILNKKHSLFACKRSIHALGPGKCLGIMSRKKRRKSSADALIFGQKPMYQVCPSHITLLTRYMMIPAITKIILGLLPWLVLSQYASLHFCFKGSPWRIHQKKENRPENKGKPGAAFTVQLRHSSKVCGSSSFLRSHGSSLNS